MNYYFGQEQPDTGCPTPETGCDGWFKVFDTYVAWTPDRSRWALASM